MELWRLIELRLFFQSFPHNFVFQFNLRSTNIQTFKKGAISRFQLFWQSINFDHFVFISFLWCRIISFIILHFGFFLNFRQNISSIIFGKKLRFLEHFQFPCDFSVYPEYDELPFETAFHSATPYFGFEEPFWEILSWVPEKEHQNNYSRRWNCIRGGNFFPVFFMNLKV